MTTGQEFTVHLVSSASMQTFPENSMASFRNQLHQQLTLEGDWRVALTEIIVPTFLNNVTDTNIRAYSKSDSDITASQNKKAMTRGRRGKQYKIKAGCYESPDKLLEEIEKVTKIKFLQRQVDSVTQKLTIELDNEEGLSFESKQIPGLLGLEGVPDVFDPVHIGFKAQAPFQRNKTVGVYPVDMTNGTQIMFVYADIIEYQILGNVKSPILRIIDSHRRLKNGSVQHQEPIHRIAFGNIEYKKLLTSTIQSVSIELRTETGKLVPFFGIGKVVLTLHFKRFD